MNGFPRVCCCGTGDEREINYARPHISFITTGYCAENTAIHETLRLLLILYFSAMLSIEYLIQFQSHNICTYNSEIIIRFLYYDTFRPLFLALTNTHHAAQRNPGIFKYFILTDIEYKQGNTPLRLQTM
jgi:hypothetical protein